MAAATFVLLEPEELFFRDVKLSQAYSQTLRITNTLRGPVELTVKPGSTDRYTVLPTSLRLKAEETALVEIRLRVLRFAQRQKAVEQGHRDVFHIKGSHFDQKFYATFWLSPESEQLVKPKPGASTAFSTTQPRSRVQETGPSPHGSPTASPTRIRKGATKSVSFAEPSSARTSFARDSDPMASRGTAESSGHGAASCQGSGDSLGSPPQMHSGLRHALADLQSPKRSAAFNAMEAGAKYIQKKAIDRANMDGSNPGAAAAAAPMATFGAQSVPRGSVSASIDFGQLATGAALGEMTHRPEPGMPSCSVYGRGSLTLSLDNLPPRGPPRSLPASPGPEKVQSAVSIARRYQLTDTDSAMSQQHVPTRGILQSASASIPPVPLGTSAVRAASSPGRDRKQQQPSAAITCISYQLTARQEESHNWGSPGRGSLPDRSGASGADAHSNARMGATQRLGTKVPARSYALPAHADSSDPKALILELQRGQQPEEGARRMEDKSLAAEEERRFLEDEARAVGLHLTRGSIESLDAEVKRLQAIAKSPVKLDSASSGSPGFAFGLESPTGRPCLGVRPAQNTGAQPRPAASRAGGDGGSQAWQGPEVRASAAQLSSGGRAAGAGSSGKFSPAGLDSQPPRFQIGLERTGSFMSDVELRRCASEEVVDGMRRHAHRVGSTTAPPRQPGVHDSIDGHHPPRSGPREAQSNTLDLQLKLQAMERQQISMARTIEQQQEVLKDKNSLLEVLQDQLKAAQAQLRVQAANRSDSPAAKVAEERSALARERESLVARLADVEADLATSREEASALRRLQLELQSRQPEVTRAVEAALMREQALQEERNRKALELLTSKDARIKELEDQVDELRKRNWELLQRVQTAETQVRSLMQAKETLVETAQRDRQHADSIIANLESRLAAGEVLNSELAAAQERAVLAEARVAEVERRLAVGEQRALEADAHVNGVDGGRRQLLLQRRGEHADTSLADAHRQQVAELEARIADLMAELSRAQGPIMRVPVAAETQKQGIVNPDAPGANLADTHSRTNLEAVNAKLEGEVQSLRRQLSASTHAAKEHAWEQVELDRLRKLVSERNVEAAELTSQVEVLKARLESMEFTAAPADDGYKTGDATSAARTPSKAFRRRASEVLVSPTRGRQQQQGQHAGRGRSHSQDCDDRVVLDDVQAAVVERLRKQLAKSEAALRASQERVFLMEARAAVAQKTAGKGEQELEAVQRSMVGSALEQQRMQQELESARATAARLNSRISDLVQAEQVARAEVDTAKAKLAQLQELHTSEILGLQERLHRLADHIASTQPEVLQVLLGPEYMSIISLPVTGAGGARYMSEMGTPEGGPDPQRQHMVGSSETSLCRERELEKAVETAETAVAVMQDRLLAALKSAADAGEEAARVQREAEWERDRLEAELRTAREEGALRIRNLEEAVARLSARGGDAAQAMARSIAEADAASRRETRLRSELGLAQQAAQRANAQAAELRLQLRDCEQALREAQVYGGLLQQVETAEAVQPGRPGRRGGSHNGAASSAFAHGLSQEVEARLAQQAIELARRQQVIARLVDVAERAQAEAADLHTELNSLKQAMPDPKQHLHVQYAEVQRRLGATEVELRACRDAKSSCELELVRLQQQLAERIREIDAASERLAACERDVAAKEDAATRKAVEVRGAMSKEVALLSRRAAESQRAADEADARARELDTQLGNLRAELVEARSELEVQATEVRQVRLKAREERRAAEEAARQSKRAAELAKQEAQERRAQLAIMMETIEVLQAGNPGEREQRIVSLTAQLSALAAQESVEEQRAQKLLADYEASSSCAEQRQLDVWELRQQVARLEQQLAAAASNRMMLEGEVSSLRSDLRTRDAAALRAARELDEREQRVAFLEGDVEALRRTLNDTQSRHAEQLAREREDAAASLRQARVESSAAAAASSQAARLERFQASLEEMIAFVESKSQQRVPTAAVAASTAAADCPEEGADQVNNEPPTQEPSSSASTTWVISAMERLKTLALESEREYMAAATDGRLYRTESRWAWSRVHRLQWALEQRTGEWQVAQARVQQLERALARRSEEAAMHALEQVALQDKQVSALNERLQATTAKLVIATSQAAGAEAALTAARAAAAALQRQVSMATAERKELTARLAAAEMEAAGSTEAVNLGTEAALAQRDLSIRQYFDAQVASMIAKPDVRDKVMALAREVCALKLSESQLLASLSAAKHRGDASAQLAASLQASLRAADEALEQVLNQQNGGSAAGSSGGGGEPGATGAVPMAAASPSVLGNLGMEVARLTAQLVAQSHEMFQLQEVALRAKQAYERRESDIEELQAQVAASELLLTQARAEGTAALFALREQLTEIHDQDRHLLIREIRELQERLTATRDLASKDVELAEQRIIDITMAKDAEIEKRVAAALDGQVDSSRLHEMEARATCAEGRVAHLEAQVETLQEALTVAQAQVTELEDLRDVTGAAVASLEATLARIEKQASSCSAAGSSVTGVGGGGGGSGRSGSGALSGGARRVVQSAANALPSNPSPVSIIGIAAGAVAAGVVATEQPLQGLAGLSREIMRAKMAEAEAVRKMRAAARSEVDLRQKLLQRDQRISELKEQLAAKTRSLEDLRRRTFPGDGHYGRAAPSVGAFGGSLSAGGAKAAIRGRSPSPSRGGAVPSASARPGAAAPRRLSAEPSASDMRPVTEATDAEYLVDQVAQLRVDVAKRQAEIDRLQGALAEANAAVVVRVEAPKPPAAPGKLGGQANGNASVDRLKDQLATANAEIVAALSTANSLLVRLQHQDGPVSGPVVGATLTSAARRTGSPARRTASAPGSLPSSESSLVPGTLSGVMQRLAAALRAVKVDKAAPALPTTGPAKAVDSPVKDARSRGGSSPTKSIVTRDGAAAAQTASGSPPPAAAVNSSLTQGSSLSAFDELVRLKEDYRALVQQRDDIDFRCRLLEGEVQRCRELMKKLQAAAGKDDVDQRADQLSKLVNAAQLSRVLEDSIGALHVLCDRMQTSAPSSQATPRADEAYQMLARLASELDTMDTTVGMLKTELGNVAQDLPKQHSPQPCTATAASTPATSDASYNPSMGPPFHIQGLAGQVSSQSITAQVPSSASLGLGTFATPSSEQTPGACLSWESSASAQVTAESLRGTKPAVESSGLDARYERPTLDQNPSGSSVGSRPAGAVKGPPLSASVNGGLLSDAAKLQSLGESAAPSGLSHAQAVALATTAAKHKARADKWKQRSKELGTQLSLLNASTAAREAAVSERHVASAQHVEEELRAWRAEAARLSAELSGVEAARKELEAIHQSSGSEVQAIMARGAEAVARAAALQQQLDSERAQAAAELASHQEEVAVLKAAVAQEKGERARLLVSLRESHNNAQQAGDSETRLRNEALEAHAAAAAARATAERAEERAEAWRTEADSLRQRLHQAERSRLNLIASLEGRLAAAERRAAECGVRTAERVEELSMQLAAALSETRAAPRVLEAKIVELEAQLASVEARTEAARQSAHGDVQVGRWDALTRIGRYKATIKQLQADLKAREARWEREKAELQATTAAAVRRSEAVAVDLKELKAQTLELQAAVDADRHQVNARYNAEIQDLQRRIEEERRLLTEQAIAKAEAAAAASERAAEEAATARLAALEGDFGRRLTQMDSARLELLRELNLVQMQFSQYQAQKAAEVTVLEERIRGYIDHATAAGGAARRGGIGAAACTGPQPARHTRTGTAAAVDRAPVRRGSATVHRHSLRRQGSLLLAARRRGRAGGPAPRDRGAGGSLGPPAADGPPPVVTIPTGVAPITSNAGEMGEHAITPSQLMALARASEALAAAQRETTFERALRGRAEAQAGLLRGAMARLWAKMRAVSEQLAEVRARAISTDEHRQLQAELASCREQLKTVRVESARRHKALQALQIIAMTQPTATAQTLDGGNLGAGGHSATSALQTAANKLARANRFATTGGLTGPMGLPPRVPSPGATVAASQGHASTVGVSGQDFPQVESSPQVRELDLNRQSLPVQGGAFLIDEDPLAATLEAAAANARAANAALEAERSARQAAEMKLKEAKAAVERKATLIRDLKRRVEDLEALLQKQAVAASEESNAESKARTLAAALTRKENMIRELRERLEAAQASLAAGNAAAEAGCEELDALRRANNRLKAELAKREASLRTALSDMEKERKQLSGVNRQLEIMTRREAAARRQAAATRVALNRRACELLEALRSISRVLLQAVAAMDAAADRLLQVHQQGETKAAVPPLGAAASAPALPSSRAMSAQDISQLTSLSVEEVRHLLGPEAGELACILGLQQRPDGQRTAAAASLEAAQRVGELLAVLEASLEAAAMAAATMAVERALDGEDTTKDVDEGPSEEEQLRSLLLAAVAEAADPAAAAATVLNSRVQLRKSTATAAAATTVNAMEAPGCNIPAGRRTSGPSRGGATSTGLIAANDSAGGGVGNDAWDGRMLQALIEEVQSEGQRAESELAAAMKHAGAL